MKVGSAPQPVRLNQVATPQPAAAAAAAAPTGPPPKPAGLKVQGDISKQASVPGPAGPGDELLALVTMARSLSFKAGKVDRGARINARGPVHNPAGEHRLSGPSGSRLGGFELRGAMSAPAAHREVTTSHPLYGRYLQQWLSTQPEVKGGKVLLQLLQSRLRDLKNWVRYVL